MSKDSSAKTAYRFALNAAAKALGTEATKVLDARIRFGRRLDLRNPTNLADKVSWLETHSDLALQARCTDKFEVRDYVEEKGLGGILIPTCGGPWDQASQVDLQAMPRQFALKATHSCGMNLICADRDALDPVLVRRTVENWLSTDYPRACLEPHYKLIPRRVYCEQYLDDASKVVDYKFHCIDGEPAFILTCSERDTGLKLNLYDLTWARLDGLVQMRNTREIERPATLATMIEVARVLSAGFRFVRVDLYEIRGEVFFGELTFSPAAGVFPYLSKEFLRRQGEALKIDG